MTTDNTGSDELNDVTLHELALEAIALMNVVRVGAVIRKQSVQLRDACDLALRDRDDIESLGIRRLRRTLNDYIGAFDRFRASVVIPGGEMDRDTTPDET